MVDELIYIKKSKKVNNEVWQSHKPFRKGLTENTRVRIQLNLHRILLLKSFYKQCFGEGLYYPKSVGWLKTSIKRTEMLLPEDILDEEDIQKMIDTVTNQRDKAIIALLFDSGIRAGELLSMRKKDIELNG